MTIRGRVHNGVVVPDEPGALPEGAEVQVSIIEPEESVNGQPGTAERRQGGQWKGRVHIADDFDKLPDDIAEAFGVKDS